MKKSVTKTKKNMTIDDLAIMVAKGFENTATKDDITVLNNKINVVDKRLDSIESRLDKIESNHERRIEKVEDKMAVVYIAFEKQLKIKLPK